MRTARGHRLLAVAALASASFSTRDAAAVRFHEPRSSLELEVGTKGAETCVLVPSSMTVPDACKGIDTASAAKKLLASAKGYVSLAAFVHFSDWGYVVLVSTMEQKGVGEMTSEEIPRFAARLEAEIAQAVGSKVSVHGEAAGSPIDRTLTNGVHTLRWIADTAYPGTERVIGYHLFEKDRYHAVSFLTDPSHQAEVRTLAAETMRTLSMPAAKLDFFGQSPQAKEAAAKGLAVTPLLLAIGAALLVLAAIVYRRRHSRREG
jgi:hypothetical protein